jgi:hypothetical protein
MYFYVKITLNCNRYHTLEHPLNNSSYIIVAPDIAATLKKKSEIAEKEQNSGILFF